MHDSVDVLPCQFFLLCPLHQEFLDKIHSIHCLRMLNAILQGKLFLFFSLFDLLRDLTNVKLFSELCRSLSFFLFLRSQNFRNENGLHADPGDRKQAKQQQHAPVE